MEEPVLSSYKGDKEIYRFTWLRTFHHPVAVRLEKKIIASDYLARFAMVQGL